jgi:hypothetical protein
MCGLTVNNCKANLKSLEAKLAIKPETAFSNTVATTYRVYSFVEILRRREAGGLTHVIRSKGSRFVHPESGIPVTGIPPVPVSGIPDSVSGIPVTGGKGVPAPGTHLRNKKERDPKEDMTAAPAATFVCSALAEFVTLSAAAAAQIVCNCQDQEPDASPEEIAHFCEVKLLQIRRDPSVKNPIALLISSVQEYFRPGSTALKAFRDTKAAAAMAELEAERRAAEHQAWQAREEGIQRQIEDAWPRLSEADLAERLKRVQTQAKQQGPNMTKDQREALAEQLAKRAFGEELRAVLGKGREVEVIPQ